MNSRLGGIAIFLLRFLILLFALASGIPGNEISFAFNAAGPEDYSYIEIPHQNWADPVYGWQVSQGQNADQVTSTGTAPPSTVDTDIIWSRITFDGTTLTVKRLVNNSSTPTESDWSSATVNFSSTAFAGGGGRLGFVPTGTGALDNLTIQSWNGSSWTTEVIDNFTVDSSGYAADTPTYDSNGNLTYDGTQSYTYDAWNRLIKISHAYRALTADGGDGNVHSGQPFETNTYDAAGRRIIKAILGTGPQDCTYHYYLSGNNIIEEQNGSTQTINQNVWGLEYIDQLVQTSFNSDPADQSTCDTPYWVMQDANYNVLGVCDNSGILRERYEYTAYGQRQVYYSTGSNDPGCYSPTSLAQLCEFGFQGLMHDQPANLLYARARFLNTELGRWNQTDPLGYTDSTNSYLAYLNNSNCNVDPFGLRNDITFGLGLFLPQWADNWLNHNAPPPPSPAATAPGAPPPPPPPTPAEIAAAAAREDALEMAERRDAQNAANKGTGCCHIDNTIGGPGIVGAMAPINAGAQIGEAVLTDIEVGISLVNPISEDAIASSVAAKLAGKGFKFVKACNKWYREGKVVEEAVVKSEIEAAKTEVAAAEDAAAAPKYGSTPEGRPFTKHYGTETGPERNIPGSVVDNTINTTPGVSSRNGTTVYYDPTNNVTVVTGNGGSIVSVHKGAP